MSDSGPNYRMYSLEQLRDALAKTDEKKFPERVAAIKHYIENPGVRANRPKENRSEMSKSTKLFFSLFGGEVLFWFILLAIGGLCFYVGSK